MITASILIFLGNVMMSVTLLLFRHTLKQWTEALLRATDSNRSLQWSNANLALKLLALSSRDN